MDDYNQDTQKKKFKLQIRKEAKELNQTIKQHAVNGKERTKTQSGIPNEEVDKYIILEDREKLREKFQFLAMDNCQLREKTTCLRYELETTQDKLEETRELLYAVKHREKANRDELAYLRHLSTNQAEEIKSLQEHVKRLQNYLHENGLEYPPEDVNGSIAPVETKSAPVEEPKRPLSLTNKGNSEPSWLQSLHAAFRKVKTEFLQASENTE